jgi:hypothetical protein
LFIGDVFIIRTAIGILGCYEKQLRQSEIQDIMKLLNNLPRDICESKLFESIASIHISEQAFLEQIQ